MRNLEITLATAAILFPRIDNSTGHAMSSQRAIKLYGQSHQRLSPVRLHCFKEPNWGLCQDEELNITIALTVSVYQSIHIDFVASSKLIDHGHFRGHGVPEVMYLEFAGTWI